MFQFKSEVIFDYVVSWYHDIGNGVISHKQASLSR